jgi:hypothetical protein
MIISDLSYLNEISEENISGAGYEFKFKKEIKANIDIKVDSKVDAKGAFNELSFDLTALGKTGSGTEVVVKQAAVYDDDYKAYVSTNEGAVSSYAI